MRIKRMVLNSNQEVVVKVVKEVLNLFKISIGPLLDPDTKKPLPVDGPYDWEAIDIENSIEASEIPEVHTRVILTALDGTSNVFRQENSGTGDERYMAGIHRLIKLNLYQLLRRELGFEAAPWGIMHGVRPTKIVHRFLSSGMDRDAIVKRLKEEYEANDEKASVITDMAIRQLPFLARTDDRTISVYVGIPFCLSRCLYCSFPANVLPGRKGLDEFMEAFRKDLAAVRQEVERYNFKVQSIYVGGGTPTSLPDNYFEEMLNLVYDSFYNEDVVEFTVEAGRPDSMSEAKLKTMLDCCVTRVSCNPQSMQQKTLKRIGRNHTTEAVVEMFKSLRSAGIPEINMDIILGLPGETVADVDDTMKKLVALGPDDITIHSLALKKGSRLKLNLLDYELPDDDTCRRMFDVAMGYIWENGYKPYYLYRQGYMSGQMENVGCAHPGAESMYNIQIMEEHQTILGIGGSATSKIINKREGRLKSSFNAKDLVTYIRDIDLYIEKRSQLLKEAYGIVDQED